MSKRIKLEVAYDGTNYCGWQIQKNANTIEGVLNEKLSSLLNENIVVIGASRTDSGVHALKNVAVFDTNTRIPSEKISYALNQRLPDDIIITSSEEVLEEFHPRYCKTVKTYEYLILNSEFKDPTKRLYTYFVYTPLNVEAMQNASEYIIGEHDFKCFCSARSQVVNTVRTIYDLKVKKEGDIISIKITGNGFLYNMVRIIAGTLLQVGKGIREPKEVENIIKSCDRKKAGPKTPANGLTLINIEYM